MPIVVFQRQLQCQFKKTIIRFNKIFPSHVLYHKCEFFNVNGFDRFIELNLYVRNLHNSNAKDTVHGDKDFILW